MRHFKGNEEVVFQVVHPKILFPASLEQGRIQRNYSALLYLNIVVVSVVVVFLVVVFVLVVSSFFFVFFVVDNYCHHQHHQTKSLHSTPFRIKSMVQTEPPPSQNDPKTTSRRKKSCIREKKNLSTDADSRTNTILERSRD